MYSVITFPQARDACQIPGVAAKAYLYPNTGARFKQTHRGPAASGPGAARPAPFAQTRAGRTLRSGPRGGHCRAFVATIIGLPARLRPCR